MFRSICLSSAILFACLQVFRVSVWMEGGFINAGTRVTQPKIKPKRAEEYSPTKTKEAKRESAQQSSRRLKWSTPSNELASEEVRDLILTQQKRWCIENRGVNGFQMDDSSLCWSPSRHLSVVNLSSPLYKEVYEVALEPQELLKNKRIRIIGDSIARFLFTAMYFVLSNQEPVYHWNASEYHSQIEHFIPEYNISMIWKWAPQASDVLQVLTLMNDENSLKDADFNIIGIGNHQRSELFMKRDFPKEMMDSIKANHSIHMNNLVFQTAPRHPSSNQTQIKFEEEFNGWLAREYTSHSLGVVDTFFPMEVIDQNDGIHSRTHAMYSAFVHLWRWKWMSNSTTDLHIRKLHESSEYDEAFASASKSK